MADRHYEIERTMTKPSAGGTVTPSTTGESPWNNENNESNDDGIRCRRAAASRSESKPVLRKRRRAALSSVRTGIPRKTPRRGGVKDSDKSPDEIEPDNVSEKCPINAQNEIANLSSFVDLSSSEDSKKSVEIYKNKSSEKDNTEGKNNSIELCDSTETTKEFAKIKSSRDTSNCRVTITEEETKQLSTKPPMHPDAPRRRSMGLGSINRRDDSARLRKTIQWLEEGARKLREDLADARAELYEERRATKLARREIEVAVREARAAEGAKHQRVIAELKTRLSQSPSCSTTEQSSAIAKAELLKDENHRREISAAKKRLAEADATIRKLRSNSLDPSPGSLNGKRQKVESPAASELRKLENEAKALRAINKKMEEKLNTICMEADKVRIMELRIQHENHEAEINALKKSLRGDAIRMMDEIRSKDREIERLGRLSRDNRKAKEDDAMRKLRENENGHQIRLAARIEDKIPQVDNVIDLCKGDCEAVAEVERLRELAIEQQEVIELLRQAVKEKERKLEQLSNKKKKEEFYKQWLELEPVAEVDDEEEHEEGDSALSSAPSSLSPQPGGYGHWQTNGVTREAYEAVLLEIEQLQTKFYDEQQELSHAKSQVRDLEKALLQETRGSQNNRRALSEKLRKLEERESNLLAEIAELREQNELLEFRVLELEESPGLRETPDTADSGIVSPEPIHIFKQEQNNKQRDRAIATVLPFSAYTHPTSPIPVKKPSLSLQESGIFEGDDDDHADEAEDTEIEENDREIEFTSCGTQTEAPVGELLQEVQRLQELRERIQERAVKVPSSSIDVKNSSNTFEFTDGKIHEDKTSLYREKIRHLEERISHFVAEQENKMKNDTLAKQREEDLLDENYRLTERVYWLENEMRNIAETKKSYVDAESMTIMKNPLINAETMTRQDFIDAETMTEDSRIEDKETIEERCLSLKNVSSSSRCENIFRTAMQENAKENASTSKSSMMEIEAFPIAQKLRTSKINGINECADCETLRNDYDEKIEQLAKAECRFRGRLIDFERKEDAFAKTLKQVDVTWKQLEADHTKNLEEIGRRLEEKVETNRRIMRRVKELEMLARNERKKESCSCKCYDASSSSSSSIDVSSSISSTCSASSREANDANNNEQMEIETTETRRSTKLVSQETQTNGDDALQSFNCSFTKQRIEEMETLPMRRISIDRLPKKVFRIPTIDISTEIAIEATEDIEEKTRDETDGGVSRIHVTPDEEIPAGESTENLRLNINETELEKKVRESWRDETVDWQGEGWVTKTWNTESYNLNGGSVSPNNGNYSRKYVFRHGGLRYVLYPEICV